MVGRCSTVTLARDARGLWVDAFSYDSFGNIEWRIYRNRFTLMSGAFVTADGFHFGNFTTLDRTDKSALRLVDDFGREIFAVRYLNRNAIQISSKVECGGLDLIPVRDNSMRMGAGGGPSCRVITQKTKR
jgi:hypothetical protein